MKRRTVLGAGLGVGAALWAGGTMPAWSAGRGQLRAGDLAAARHLFTAGEYSRLHQVLPALLAAAHEAGAAGPVKAGRAAGVWVLSSQLAVKQGAMEAAGDFAGQASAAARSSGDPMLLAAAARAAATPLRRTGRADQALHLLRQAHDHLTAGPRPSAATLDAAGMVALTAAYTAAQAHLPSPADEFVALAEQTAVCLAHHNSPPRGELSAQQCALYRIGMHRELGDIDRALAYAAALDPAALPTPERRARAATDTARALLAADDAPAAFTQLQLVEEAAPQEVRRPSVRAVTEAVAALRPDLPGIAAFTRRTAASRPST
ncbi:transcriptional regulator [Streptomyces sp. N2A]|uniref:transcriptional regulator n=1 Tax=Streptomyces sp. N2A TaxID=3073936 RepID=UPI00286FC92C|nr:transcriptional regulator [Streptomyces sp. N2A]